MVEHSENQRKWLQAAIVAGHIISIPFATFDQAEIVARGAFGEVSRAYWKSAEKTVALKNLYNNPVMGTEGSFEEFVKELKLIRSVDFHDNVIRFYGVSEDPATHRYFMVLQYANGGNLRDFLNKHHEFLNWETRINMASQIASGLKCIHERNIVHRDLHSKNILVHDGKMMITDFGLSKSLDNNEHSVVGGMVGYIEPQCFIDSTYKRDKASDIYSLGVLLWEISSGKPPFNNMAILDIAREVVQGRREAPIKGSPPAYVAIYQMAWDNDSKKRPTINKVREDLEKLQSNCDIERLNLARLSINSQGFQGSHIPAQQQLPQLRPHQQQQRPLQSQQPQPRPYQTPQPQSYQHKPYQQQQFQPQPYQQQPSQPQPYQHQQQPYQQPPPPQPYQRQPPQPQPYQQQPSQPQPYQQQLPPQPYQQQSPQPQPYQQQPPQPRPYQSSQPQPYQQQPPQPRPYQPPQQQPYQQQPHPQQPHPQQPHQQQPHQQQPPQPRPYQPPQQQPHQQQPHQQQPPQPRPQNYNNNAQSNPIAQQQNHTLHSIPIVQNQVLQHHSNQYHLGIQNQPGLQRNNTMRQQQYSQPPSQPFNNSYPHHPPQRPMVHPSQSPHKCTCADTMTKYIEEFQNTRGYEKPGECHAGYHAGMGDVLGLRWHLFHDRRVDGTYNFVDTSDKLVLIAAKFCARKNLNIMFQCLKEYGANFKVVTKKKGLTAFHLLFFNNSLSSKIKNPDKLKKYHNVFFQAIKFLKEAGCNINAKDDDGMTILSYFLEEKFSHEERTPIIQALLDNGADPNLPVTIKDWGGSKFDAKTSLLQAVRNRWPTTVLELIVKHHVDVKAINDEGMNALAIATQAKDISTMTWMLENISILSDSDSIKIAKKFSGKFTTKESQLLSKKRNKVLPNDLSSFSSSSSTSNINGNTSKKK